MGLGSGWHWLLVLLVFVLLFGAGKISGLMGDLAKGIKSFKKEMAEGGEAPEEPAKPEPAKVIEHKVEKPARATTTKSASKAPRSRKSG
jgi:sec-independent protein translocase protein TatA